MGFNASMEGTVSVPLDVVFLCLSMSDPLMVIVLLALSGLSAEDSNRINKINARLKDVMMIRMKAFLQAAYRKSSPPRHATAGWAGNFTTLRRRLIHIKTCFIMEYISAARNLIS
jgi:hypothetical protein